MECYQVPTATAYLTSGTLYPLNSSGDELDGVALTAIVLFEDGDGELQNNKIGVTYACQIAASQYPIRPKHGTRIVLDTLEYKILTVARHESPVIKSFWLCKIKTID